MCSSVMMTERALTIEEAGELRLLLFGNKKDTFGAEWVEQSFCFRSESSYGFFQRRAGPCGVLAAVQAYVIYELVFGVSKIDVSSGVAKMNLEIQWEALARALTEILWQAGDAKNAVVVELKEKPVFDTSAARKHLKLDGFIENLYLKNFKCRTCLFAYCAQIAYKMTVNDTSGCIIFLYSLILTRGIQKIKSEMDSSNNYLIGRDGYCSQEIINLILVGRAVSNVFDEDRELNSGGTEPTMHRGIPRQSKIGLLSLTEYNETCPVGQFLKNPEFPIWLLLGESHYTVLFAITEDVLQEKLENQPLILYHYDGFKEINAETVYNTELLQNLLPAGKIELHTVALCCISTRWPLPCLKEIQQKAKKYAEKKGAKRMRISIE